MATLSDLLAVQAAQGVSGGIQKAVDTDAARQAAQVAQLSALMKTKQEGQQNIERDNAAQTSSLNTAGKLMGVDASTPEGQKAIGDMLIKHGGAAGKDMIRFGPDQATKIQMSADAAAARDARDRGHMVEAQKRGAAKTYGEAYKGIDGVLEPLSIIQNLAKDPSSFGDEAMKTLKARTVEGKGQRLLQGVIQHMGGNPTMFSKTEDAVNWIKGQANSTMAPEVRSKLLESLKPYAAEAETDLNDTDSRMTQNHDLSFDKLENGADKYIKTYGGAARTKLGKIKEGFAAQAAAPQAVNPNPVAQGLAGLFGKSPAAPAAAPAPTGAMSFEDWKKANGR